MTLSSRARWTPRGAPPITAGLAPSSETMHSFILSRQAQPIHREPAGSSPVRQQRSAPVGSLCDPVSGNLRL